MLLIVSFYSSGKKKFFSFCSPAIHLQLRQKSVYLYVVWWIYTENEKGFSYLCGTEQVQSKKKKTKVCLYVNVTHIFLLLKALQCRQWFSGWQRTCELIERKIVLLVLLCVARAFLSFVLKNRKNFCDWDIFVVWFTQSFHLVFWRVFVME